MTSLDDSIVYRVYYDKFPIGVATEDIADFPSIHCKIELEEVTDAPTWVLSIERYQKLCIEHHQFMMDQNTSAATALGPKLLEAAAPFGDHLWFIVNIDTGLSTKINRPYFGTDNYFRFSYAKSKLDFDRRKLQARLQTRFMLMTASIASACETMERPLLKLHLDALGKLSGILARTSPDGADLNYLVDRWYQELKLLDTTLPIFNDPSDRRRLEQECAI